ncbi:HAD-like domain-containing protein [Durotheca rogersii]|uniref:HAD-like domain-containing protein n=1 Tax=Durotheca rogersii TaxID=419775 RepID=UPI00222026CA|nr:HAD-like domain-containing protein [Durotheca rogersii]KAI5868698.1 HAD-like domain-containing protein [Durotheca rogersii]
MADNQQTSSLPLLQTQPKAIFFTDFDGTITLDDSNDFLTDNLGFGNALRRQLNYDVIYGRRPFRDTFQEMMDSVRTPFDQCVDTVRERVVLDPAFVRFFHWCRGNNVPVVVLSGGMRPMIRALLAHLVGEELVDTMQIVSNDVAARPGKTINDEGGWTITFRDDRNVYGYFQVLRRESQLAETTVHSSFGHDKSRTIKPYSSLPERPILFYAGDGVSDLSAAKETDLLFAKANCDLVTYCEHEKAPFVTFNNFSEIHETVASILDGKISVKEAAVGRK